MSEGIGAILIGLSTWLTPQPQLSAGLLVNYGAQETVEGMAWYRSYDLAPYYHRCGISAMSPAHLGRVAWLRVEGGPWVGPCVILDAAAQHDFYRAVYELGEVAEVPRWLAERLGFEHGRPGYLWIGLCPPPTEDWATPRPYRPRLAWSVPGEGRRPLFQPHLTPQQWPVKCAQPAWN